MNKKDVVAALKTLGLNKGQAEGALEKLAEMTAAALGRGEKVVLDGLGSFQVKQRAARAGRNPRTGEPIEIPARRSVLFKPGARLRARLEE